MPEKVLFSPPYDIAEHEGHLHRRDFYAEAAGFGYIDSGPSDIIRVSFEDELPPVIFNPDDGRSGISGSEIDDLTSASVIVTNGINEAQRALREGKTREDWVQVIN